jgi:hypothetical protein
VGGLNVKAPKDTVCFITVITNYQQGSPNKQFTAKGIYTKLRLERYHKKIILRRYRAESNVTIFHLAMQPWDLQTGLLDIYGNYKF